MIYYCRDPHGLLEQSLEMLAEDMDVTTCVSFKGESVLNVKSWIDESKLKFEENLRVILLYYGWCEEG